MAQKLQLVGAAGFVDVHRSANSVVKRSVDLVGGFVGLVVLAIVFLPVAIAIKIDSPGPVFLDKCVVDLQGDRLTSTSFVP